MNPQKNAFHEIWQLKFNDSTSSHSLWLRFSVLVSKNGFREIAEVWAILSHRGAQNELKKTALKQSFELNQFRKQESCAIQMGECVLNLTGSTGRIQSKGQSLNWNLSWTPQESLSFQAIPSLLRQSFFSHHSHFTHQEDLSVSGSFTLNDERIELSFAHACLSQISQPSTWSEEAWAHCNEFKTEQGEKSDFIFEAYSAQPCLGPIALPPFSSFYLRYEQKVYALNLLRHSVFQKSTYDINGWTFQIDQGDLSFRGQIKAELRDFTGLTYETINGSLLFSSHSNTSNLKVLVYRRGKLESTLVSQGTTAFQISSKQKNPYIPSLL